MSTKKKFFRSWVPYKGEEYRDRLDDTFQRKNVHCRQWRFVTYDGIIFCESQREEDYSMVKQNDRITKF